MTVSVKLNTKNFEKIMNNLISYSDGFFTQTKAKSNYVAQRLGKGSIEEFYRYLDSLASTNPGMLHHIYEWGSVGNPSQRLVELKSELKGNAAVITAEYLPSSSISDESTEPFVNKAEIMEEGIPVVVDTVNAKALFFKIDGEEFFSAGPIVIENPGGVEVRGQFVAQFEEFYGKYFEEVYLRAIRFYDHFQDPREYKKNIGSIKSGDARAQGKRSALSWLMRMPGDE
jgi:hypothetical protein